MTWARPPRAPCPQPRRSAASNAESPSLLALREKPTSVGAVSDSEVTSGDLLIDGDARATWQSLSAEQQEALLRWVNRPRLARNRRHRRVEVSRGLQSGAAYTGLEALTFKETLFESLFPW